MRKNKIFVGMLMLMLGTSLAHAQGNNSQAGGLPALEARVAALEALLAAFTPPGYPDVYSGTYSVTLIENNKFGCGFTKDFGSVAGTPQTFVYFSNQAISSNSTNSVYLTAESDGEVISFPAHITDRQELRLSGLFENDDINDGGFDLEIGANGALSLPGEPDFIGGQMSQDGNTFHALARFEEEEAGPPVCTDAGTILLIGVRQ